MAYKFSRLYTGSAVKSEGGFALRKITREDGENTTITFTVAGTTLQAEQGMTWAEWVESEYNINGAFVVTADDTIVVGYSKPLCTESGTVVYSSHVIIADKEYQWQSEAGYTLSGAWKFNEKLIYTDDDNYSEFSRENYFFSNDTKMIGLDFWGVDGELIYDDDGAGGGGRLLAWSSGKGWASGDAYRTINFDSTRTVSAEFYEWFTANATMSAGGAD